MVKTLDALMSSWTHGREILFSFLLDLSDEDLDKLLSRQALNTIRLQIEELLEIQYYYVDAMKTGRMTFNGKPEYDMSKKSLLKGLKTCDEMLVAVLNGCDGSEEVIWSHGGAMDIHTHFANMIGHEMMHIGQIIAFCCATGITIPEKVVNTMFLDG